MESTGFKDCKGETIYVGQALSVWDDEGGSGVGIVTKHKKYEFLIIDPSKDYREEADGSCRIWSFTELKSFAPNHVQILKCD